MTEKKNTTADHWAMIAIGLIGMVAFSLISVQFDTPFATGIFLLLAGTSGVIYATGVGLWALRTFRRTQAPSTDG